MLYRASLLAALVLAGYSLLVGVGLLAGWFSAERGYLLMALPCLVPAVWYGASFLRATTAGSNFGLLVSAAGWALMAFGFLIKDSVFRSATALTRLGGNNIVDPENAPVATLCFVLALVCLLVGASLSLGRRE